MSADRQWSTAFALAWRPPWPTAMVRLSHDGLRRPLPALGTDNEMSMDMSVVRATLSHLSSSGCRHAAISTPDGQPPDLYPLRRGYLACFPAADGRHRRLPSARASELHPSMCANDWSADGQTASLYRGRCLAGWSVHGMAQGHRRAPSRFDGAPESEFDRLRRPCLRTDIGWPISRESPVDRRSMSRRIPKLGWKCGTSAEEAAC